ncbi:hypothetical protein AV530_005568 [Patagioenas fasciata monilis]|uniref:Uncharacterized protein n=1 Tax=Patagioenas fasciata monilis TaxID=372326 RepID=A0A1V4JM34_PATFA|nr:hypothetical protein AV530_005568 [Patagioenas fasciata monilis]
MPTTLTMTSKGHLEAKGVEFPVKTFIAFWLLFPLLTTDDSLQGNMESEEVQCSRCKQSPGVGDQLKELKDKGQSRPDWLMINTEGCVFRLEIKFTKELRTRHSENTCA